MFGIVSVIRAARLFLCLDWKLCDSWHAVPSDPLNHFQIWPFTLLDFSPKTFVTDLLPSLNVFPGIFFPNNIKFRCSSRFLTCNALRANPRCEMQISCWESTRTPTKYICCRNVTGCYKMYWFKSSSNSNQLSELLMVLCMSVPKILFQTANELIHCGFFFFLKSEP